MSEMEVPLDRSQEDMEHHAHHSPEKWITWVALTSALIAVMAAVTVLIAGGHADEGMLKALEKNDSWGFYQAKSIKAAILETKVAVLTAQKAPIAPEDEAKQAEYKQDEAKIKKQAEDATAESIFHLKVHDVMGYGVTFFQVSIAVAAIAALSKQRPFWIVGLLFAAVGTFFAVKGMLMKPEDVKPEGKGSAMISIVQHLG